MDDFAMLNHNTQTSVFATPLLKYPRARMHTKPRTKNVNNFVDKK